MILLTLLLAVFLRVAFGAPLTRPHCTKTTGGDEVNAADCHQIIDQFSQLDPSGYITIEAGGSLVRQSGSCIGLVRNRMATLVTINEAELAFQMTANIFNPCIVNGMYGQWWWDDKITARLDMPKKVPWEEVIRGNHHPEQKRAVADDPDMLCYKPWTPFERPPNITDCREAMDVLSQSSRIGNIELSPGRRLVGLANNCGAHICNTRDEQIKLNELSGATVAELLTADVFDTCVIDEGYGTWWYNNALQGGIWGLFGDKPSFGNVTARHGIMGVSMERLGGMVYATLPTNGN